MSPAWSNVHPRASYFKEEIQQSTLKVMIGYELDATKIMHVRKDQQLNKERKIFLVIKLSFHFVVSHRTSAADEKLLR